MQPTTLLFGIDSPAVHAVGKLQENTGSIGSRVFMCYVREMPLHICYQAESASIAPMNQKFDSLLFGDISELLSLVPLTP